MNRLPLTLLLASLLLTPVLLVACDDHHHRKPQARSERHDRGDGAIDLSGDAVLIEAGGENALARVGPDGSLLIGELPVDVSPEGLAALKAYNAAAFAMKTHALALGRAGAGFGVDTVGSVLRGLFSGDLDAVGARARHGAHALVAEARELCTRMAAMQVAQQSAAAAVPAFVPYAVLDAEQVRECREEIDEQLDEQGDEAGKRPAAGPAAPPATGSRIAAPADAA